MSNILEEINENIIKEKQNQALYDEWKPEIEFEDNPKIKQGIELSPGECRTKLVERHKPCRNCGNTCYLAPNALCDWFKEIVFPSCAYCSEEKVKCKCALGRLHEQLKYRK